MNKRQFLTPRGDADSNYMKRQKRRGTIDTNGEIDK